MCYSDKLSVGGAIAIIHPILGDGTQHGIKGSLLFSNSATDVAEPTRMVWQVVQQDDEKANKGRFSYEVQIHQHGDLTIATPTKNTNPILHSITVEGSGLPAEAQRLAAVSVGSRLELGVSEVGIIGRTVSVLRDGCRVGEGVVGWN